MMNKTLFSFLILISSSLVLCSLKEESSPQSPRASKTKSPVNLAVSSNFSPITKKKKVSINVPEIFYENDAGGNKNENLYKEKLELNRDQKSSQSNENLPLSTSESTLFLRPILRRREINKNYPNILQLIVETTAQELKEEFYGSGVQLPINNNFNILNQLFDFEKSTEVFNFLTDSYPKKEVDAKLKIIYNHDKALFMSNLLEIDFVIDELVLIRLFEIMFNGGDEEKEILLDLKSDFNQSTIKAKLFLHAIYFKIPIIYKVFMELLESPDNSWKLQLARAILIRYNTQSMIQSELMPLMIYAVKNDSEEESVRMMMDFEASEANHLDSFGCSPIYYAAYHGRLDLLELFKERRVEINGKGPLIGAACDDRDESLKWFLIDQARIKDDKDNQEFQYKFTIKDIENAALAAATNGHSGVIKFFLKNKSIGFNLHFHQGSDTLLSVALKNDRIGFVTRLVNVFNFDVNFSGDDPINPNGHALTFLLEKPSIMEFFLTKGATRDVLVPAKSSNSEYIELVKYVETCENEQLIKIFNKYNRI